MHTQVTSVEDVQYSCAYVCASQGHAPVFLFIFLLELLGEAGGEMTTSEQ